MKKLRIAIIGQGRSGSLIHGAYYQSQQNCYFEVAYVVDYAACRREQALLTYPGCITFSDYKALLTLSDIDLVVNASYSEQHTSITLDLLQHGFHVLVEKPFAPHRHDCERLLDAAKENHVLLAVFQQTNLAPFFVFTKEVIQSGKLGTIKQIDITYNSFARRWDWQTLQKKLAGSLYNTGPHPIGMGLSLLDFDPNVRLAYARLDTAMTSGDGEDYVKLILSAPGKPVVDIEICATDAYPAKLLKLQGSRGTYQCSPTGYEMQYMLEGENPPRPVIEDSMRNEKNEPIYCVEQLKLHTESGTFQGDAFDVGTARFYENLYHTLLGEDTLYFPPEQVMRIIDIIEQAHRENPLPKRF